MTTAKTLMEIREDDIRKHYPQAFQLLSGFDHAPRIAEPRSAPAATGTPRSGLPGRRAFRSTTPGLVTQSRTKPTGVRLIDRIESLDQDDPLLSATQASVLNKLRRALATAQAVVEIYEAQTNLGRFKQQNLEGRLSAAHQVEFSELLVAASLIALHSFANMSAFLLAPLLAEARAEEVDAGVVEEILVDNPPLALQGALWELDQTLGQLAKDDDGIVPVIGDFMEKLMESVGQRAKAATRLEPFTSASYRIEADGFEIDGFTPATRGRASVLTMAFKKPQEVVGNHIAKYQCQKLAKMLMAYDFERQLNPFAELGGFVFTFMGDGKPGTGKTTLIQMLAGLLDDYCRTASYPFRYENLSSEAIDSYQGKSGQNAKAFIRAVMDPHVIGFGTVDDIDQIAGKRGDRQSSAGQQEVTAVLMESFGGANTVVRGNCTFGMFSNYPENVDDALRQRAGARFLVDGPQSREDYIDILHLLLGSNHDIPVGDHDLYAAQEIRSSVSRSYAQHSRPLEPQLAEVFDQAKSDLGALDSIETLGAYLKAIQERNERFTGRAIKNITDAVKLRAMDFELPDEWIETPEPFLAKDYETKTAMIKELMRPITVEMVIQEINRYADSEFRYANVSDEAAISARVREMTLNAEARRRYGDGA